MTQPAKILIVDDEENIRFFLQDALERDGHRVTAVESGEAALKRLKSEKFDLALIDLKLPGVGGMQVLAAARQVSPDTVVIMLTAHASLETAVEALRQGAHDYLFKPCQTLQLRESVRTGLQKRYRELRQREFLTQLERTLRSNLDEIHANVAEGAVPAGAVPAPDSAISEPEVEQGQRFLKQGDLIVDLTRHVITLGGCLLELSPTEFNLLAYLVSEAPRVVSAQELVCEVQGYQSETWDASEITRYHIHHIRRKVKEATGRTDIIRTVRGVGYTLG